jgi:hypothetical protein
MKHCKSIYYLVVILPLLAFNGFGQNNLHNGQDLPLSTQLTISRAAIYNQNNEILNVFLVYNSGNQSKGTGFLLKSGHVITNEHVVHNARLDQIVLVSPTGQQLTINNKITDTVRDLAILFLSKNIQGGFELGDDNSVLIGNQAYSWGFPLEYNGPAPLLSVGYLAGVNGYRPYPNKIVKHWVVNGALNPGNSGGPLIVAGKVIGIVQSKAAPITPYIMSALNALNNNKSGVIYTNTDATGKTSSISEAQIIGQILIYYREIAQVMIGEAVSISELKSFLMENKITGY